MGTRTGDACVIYRNGDKYYAIDACHCSCYGLEGKFDPEVYDKETLIAAWEKSNPYGAAEEAKPIILALKAA